MTTNIDAVAALAAADEAAKMSGSQSGSGGAQTDPVFRGRLVAGLELLMALARADEQATAQEAAIVLRFARRLAAHSHATVDEAFFTGLGEVLPRVRADRGQVLAAVDRLAADQSVWDFVVEAISDLVAADGSFTSDERRFIDEIIARATR